MAKGRRKSKSSESKATIAWRVIASRASTAAFVVVLAALGLAWVFAQGSLRQRVAEARAQPITLLIRWPSVSGDRGRTWMPESVRREIEQVVLSRVSPDVFDRGSLEETRAALLRTGWFEDIEAVRRLEGNMIEVDGAWRTPMALVRLGDTDHVVGAGGALLPLSYKVGGAGPALKFIEGVTQAGPTLADGSPAWGQPWPGGEVQAGQALIDTLRRAFSATRVWPQIAGVDAGQFTRSGRLAIITDRGARVVWGAPPGLMAPGEQTTDQKIARLVHMANGPSERIDAGEPWVEIQGAHVYVDSVPPASAVARGANGD